MPLGHIVIWIGLVVLLIRKELLLLFYIYINLIIKIINLIKSKQWSHVTNHNLIVYCSEYNFEVIEDIWVFYFSAALHSLHYICLMTSVTGYFADSDLFNIERL